MTIKNDLDKLVDKDLISPTQAEKIRAFYDGDEHVSHFSVANILYYLGGFLIVFALIFWAAQHWESFGEWGHVVIAAGFVSLLGGVGYIFEHKKFKTPSTILFLSAVAAFSVFLYTLWVALGLVSRFDYFEFHFDGHTGSIWLLFDSVMILISVGLLYILPRTLLTLPLVHFSWMFILGLTNLVLFPGLLGDSVRFISWINLFVGLLLIGSGFLAHGYKKKHLIPFPWLYGGLLMFAALASLRFDTWGKNPLPYIILIGLYGTGFLYLSSPYKSKLFLAFGSVGIFWFINDLAWEFFEDSLGFSFALIVSGLLSIGFAYFLQKYYKKSFK